MNRCVSLALLILLTNCAAPPATAGKKQIHEFAEPHMGCVWRLKIVSESPQIAATAAEAAFARIKALEKIFSDYQPDSELNRLCATAGSGAETALSAELFAILEKSQEFARLSEGAFDCTLGPCTRLWRAAKKSRQLPTLDEIANARGLCGWRFLKLNREKQAGSLEKSGMQLDLGGIAKGWTLDEITRLLRDEFHLTEFLLDASGQLAAMGQKPDGSAWNVAIEKIPQEPDASKTTVLSLTNLHLATSGDLHQFIELNGVRYSHIIDPKTGLGSQQRTQASVVAPNGTDADALATILCLANEKEAREWLKKFPNTEAKVLRVSETGTLQVWETEGWGRLLATKKD